MENGRVEVGHFMDLHDNPKIVDDSVEFDDLLWLAEKGKLRRKLEESIAVYGRQYNVAVSRIAMVGDVYIDGKKHLYGRYIPASVNPLDYITDFDLVEVNVVEGDMVINFEKGNQRGALKLYLISKAKLKRLTDHKRFTNSMRDFELISKGSSPVKFYEKEKELA